MGFYVNSTDFIGKFEIHQGMYDVANIDAYIQKYELRYLVELLGVDLYNSYYLDANAQIDHIPLNPLFKFLYDPFQYQLNMQYWTILYSYGIKEMLLGFIYFEYNKDFITANTLAGNVTQKSENSEGAFLTIYGKYNDAIKTYRAIQDYILFNSGSYPTFRGMPKQYAYWL
ncbi:hypothetical protein UFOVP597_4 [uncultured Caudovirales phage]|uniref:Uncharacterized protein n=1 Tax=uncultured Caudovirales phage TaxID=2100421 RepID=A0A6J5MVB5_9CAUD|nr:hypothetical protein UFOVP597_4 [uncultured Caudovirales phage]